MIDGASTLLAAIALCGAVEYSVTDLGSLAGVESALPPGTMAADVNASGVAVGSSVLSGTNANIRAFTWNGSMTELSPVGDDAQSQAFGVSDDGDVIGVSFQLGDLLPTGMLWNAGRGTELGAFVPQDIRDGIIAGVAPTDPTGLHFRAATWASGVVSTLTDLGGPDSTARAIAPDGRIVGGATLPGDNTHRATLWLPDGTLIQLTLSGFASSEAFDIAAGRIVGHGRLTTGEVRAFVADVDASGVVTDLRILAPNDDSYSYARAVNESGVVVGAANARAMRWDAAGAPVDLNDVIDATEGWVLTHAASINNAGMIVGRGTHLGKPRAYLLTPVDPCPGDADGDGTVGFNDLNLVLEMWGAAGGSGADVTGDGVVDFDDLNLVLAGWGDDCTGTAGDIR